MDRVSAWVEAKKQENKDSIPEARRGVTVRLVAVSLRKLDRLAKGIGVTRTGMLEKIAELAIEDAYRVYFGE